MLMTIETLLQSDLRREFEKVARAAKKNPAHELAELMAEYVERKTDITLYNAISAETQLSDYDEDESVELVRAYRNSLQK